MESSCKFYEPDIQAQKEAEEMESLIPEIFMGEEMDSGGMDTPGDDPFAACGAFCKHLKSGRGYPGEYVYYCCAEGNMHIIDVDFNGSEII